MKPKLARLTLGFAAIKALARADGNPRECPHNECKRCRICIGEPRGTLRRDGKPLCRLPRVASAIAANRNDGQKA